MLVFSIYRNKSGNLCGSPLLQPTCFQLVLLGFHKYSIGCTLFVTSSDMTYQSGYPLLACGRDITKAGRFVNKKSKKKGPTLNISWAILKAFPVFLFFIFVFLAKIHKPVLFLRT